MQTDSCRTYNSQMVRNPKTEDLGPLTENSRSGLQIEIVAVIIRRGHGCRENK